MIAEEHLTFLNQTRTTATTSSTEESQTTQSSTTSDSTMESQTQGSETETQNILRIAGFAGTTAETFIANYPNIDITTKSDESGDYPDPSQPEGTTVLNPVGGDNDTGLSSTADDTWLDYYVNGTVREEGDADFAIRKYAEETGTEGLFNIFLEVKGNALNSDTAQPVDIVIVADRSGSMKENKRLTYLKEGVESFVKAIKEHNLEEVIHMGYVSFAESASTLEGDSGFKSLPIASVADNDIVSELGKTTALGGTNTQAGLLEAENLINIRESDKRENTKTVIVLLTDGVPTYHYQITELEPVTGGSADLRVSSFDETVLKGIGARANLSTSDSEPEDYRIYTAPISGTNTIEQITNNFVAPVSVANDLKRDGVEIRVIGIELSGELDKVPGVNYDYSSYPSVSAEEITKQMQSIASVRSDDGTTQTYYYTNVSAAKDIVNELEAIATDMTSTVVNGSIKDPMGSNILFEEGSVKITQLNESTIASEKLPTSLFDSDKNTLTISNINVGADEIVRIQYSVRIDTESANFNPDTWMLANGVTEFLPTSDHTDPVEFAVPAVKVPGVTLTIDKTWLNDTDTQRPETLSFTVFRESITSDSKDIGKVELTKLDVDGENADKWVSSFTQTSTGIDFVKYDSQGNEFTYTVVEGATDDYEETEDSGGFDETEAGFVFSFINQRQDKPLSFTIEKVSSVDGQSLTGAEFTISGMFYGETEARAVPLTDQDNGEYVLPDDTLLADNSTYTLTEVKAPAGHETSGPWTISVKEGQVTINDGEVDVDANDHFTYTIENSFVPLNLNVTKVSATDEKTPLAGARFALSSQGSNTKYGVSNENGKLSFTGLMPGDYLLEETVAPNGYQISASTWTFTIDINGQVTDEQNEFSVDSDGITINKEVTNPLKAFDLVVKKVNEVGKAIEGATFTLTNQETQELLEATVQTNTFTFVGLTPGIYELEETEAPENYIGLRETITVEIAENGEVSVSEQANKVETTLNQEGNNKVIFEVENIHVNSLPATGGPGIWAFLMVGGLIIGGAFIKRKGLVTKGGRN
ncbi:SpaA isopeptide-forming pilin-related protein [Enterococcus sp. RIT-PI-f]|uniref:SpaA isopeptide-forming pilin-related protein n=1 Tax=Enterococcus sp. RIT-PI-f TaxID=1690244 RepID=UPI0006B997D8|nr:SpaA isopeptide-forming pilin-related protein [Enterococcus sp. RIT-PI-f]KPG71746.1 hypothetical protein AEQ18_03665 [Enterococcus sp. RIT-PI-f]